MKRKGVSSNSTSTVLANAADSNPRNPTNSSTRFGNCPQHSAQLELDPLDRHDLDSSESPRRGISFPAPVPVEPSVTLRRRHRGSHARHRAGMPPSRQSRRSRFSQSQAPQQHLGEAGPTDPDRSSSRLSTDSGVVSKIFPRLMQLHHQLTMLEKRVSALVRRQKLRGRNCC
jgi:hypothetical protein